MKFSFKELIVPVASAIVGGIVVLAVLKVNPALQLKLNHSLCDNQNRSTIYDDFFKDPLSERFFGQEDPLQGQLGEKPLYEITQREDEKFVYYDIKIEDLNSTSLDTKVENGYVTVTGTLEKKSGSSQYSSKFNQSFPLPDNVDGDKMQLVSEKDKVVLKFPKVNAQ